MRGAAGLAGIVLICWLAAFYVLGIMILIVIAGVYEYIEEIGQ